MPAISPQRMQDRYDAILDAAKGAFADKGFEGTSIAGIARVAQISDGLVYRYFRSKRELLYEVLRKFYERILLDLETQVFSFGEKVHSARRLHATVRGVAKFSRCRKRIAVFNSLVSAAFPGNQCPANGFLY